MKICDVRYIKYEGQCYCYKNCWIISTVLPRHDNIRPGSSAICSKIKLKKAVGAQVKSSLRVLTQSEVSGNLHNATYWHSDSVSACACTINLFFTYCYI